ncbi:MAG: hypothetical protein AB1445_10055 [Bacillota bacterium]
MELNWIRIVAQLLNLALLVYLLKRFLFAPIASIMAERERRISHGLDQGRKLVAEGQALAAEYHQRLGDLEREKERLLQEARQLADAQRHELLAEARKEAEAAHRHFHQSLEQEKGMVLLHLQEEIISHACQLAQRVLAELADTALEEAALGVLVGRLHEAKTGHIELLKAGLATDPLMVVTTGRPLSPGARTRAEAAILQACRPHVPTIEFRADAGLVFGVAIQTTAASLEWNAAGYLRRVEKDSRQELLDRDAAREAAGHTHA